MQPHPTVPPSAEPDTRNPEPDSRRRTPLGSPLSPAWDPAHITLVEAREAELNRRICGARTLSGADAEYPAAVTAATNAAGSAGADAFHRTEALPEVTSTVAEATPETDVNAFVTRCAQLPQSIPPIVRTVDAPAAAGGDVGEGGGADRGRKAMGEPLMSSASASKGIRAIAETRRRPNREFQESPSLGGKFASLFFATHFRGASAWRGFVRQVKRVCA